MCGDRRQISGPWSLNLVSAISAAGTRRSRLLAMTSALKSSASCHRLSRWAACIPVLSSTSRTLHGNSASLGPPTGSVPMWSRSRRTSPSTSAYPISVRICNGGSLFPSRVQGPRSARRSYVTARSANVSAAVSRPASWQRVDAGQFAVDELAEVREFGSSGVRGRAAGLRSPIGRPRSPRGGTAFPRKRLTQLCETPPRERGGW
jgi:hypothetical protein